MITHDAAAGTGGLDASAAFETDRPDSFGGGAINSTFGSLTGFHGARASAADLLAMSVVVALAGCGGPRLPFRAGRQDKAGPGPPGVPQPDEDAKTLEERFRRAGFRPDEMVGLVACGHTIRGLQSTNFPEITGTIPDSENDTLSAFDETFAEFDNNIVTEYLDGTTKNPLVVGNNETLNSDLAVFSSDGNKTVSKLADKAVFRSTCADLLGRMIDTVPEEVNLSNPIEPPEVKPYLDPLVLSSSSSGNRAFAGRVRIRTTPGTSRDADDLAVRLTYHDRDGVESSREIPTERARFRSGLAYGLYGESFVWFKFESEIPTETGISKIFLPRHNAFYQQNHRI